MSGFWPIKGHVGTRMTGIFRTRSPREAAVPAAGLAMVVGLSYIG